MEAIQNIIFDLGGVILDIDFKKTEEAFVKLGVVNFADLFAHGKATALFRNYETGEVTDEGFIAGIQQLSDLSITDKEVSDAWNALLLNFQPERIELLKELQKKYRLFLFSNTNAIHLECLQLKYRAAFGGWFDDLFQKAYYSHLIKRRKPDTTAFEYVIHDSGVEPSVTLFIDDYLANAEGARLAGLQAIHLEPGKTLLDLGL